MGIVLSNLTLYEGCSIICRRFSHLLSDSTKESKSMIQSSRLYSNNAVTKMFQDVHSPDKLSDHDIVSGTLKIFIPPIKTPRRKVYLNGHSDTRSVQENFDVLTSFIQDSADKHFPSKTSRSIS